jgi:hypothetical protein
MIKCFKLKGGEKMILDTYTTKEMIITSIDSQIESLIKSYEKQLNNLKEENLTLVNSNEKQLDNLKHELASLMNSNEKHINYLKNENISLVKSYERKLQDLKEENSSLVKTYEKQLINIKAENSSLKESYGNHLLELKDEHSKLLNEKVHLSGRLYQQSDKLSERKKVDVKNNVSGNNNTQNSLSTYDVKKFIRENLNHLHDLHSQSSIEQCTDILANINAIDPKLFSDSEQKLLIVFLESLIKFEPKKELVINFTYGPVLSIIKRFDFSNEFNRFVKRNGSLLTKRVFGIKDANLIGELSRIYFFYKNFECLSTLLEQLFANWSFIDDKMRKQDFIHTLWYSFFLDKDNKIPKNSEMVNSYLKDNDPALVSYRTYYEIINGKVNYEIGFKKIEDGLGKSIYLGKREKEKLLISIDKRLKKFNKRELESQKIIPNKVQLNNTKNSQIVGYITKIPNSITLNTNTGSLYREEWVNLAVFSDSLLHL